MDRSRSSGGVGWSNGYWGIVTSKRTPRLARLEVRRKSLNMISSLCLFFCIFATGKCSPIEILCHAVSKTHFFEQKVHEQ